MNRFERAKCRVEKIELQGTSSSGNSQILETTLGEGRQPIEKGDYLSAQAQSKVSKDKGVTLSEKSEAAIEKTIETKPTARA